MRDVKALCIALEGEGEHLYSTGERGESTVYSTCERGESNVSRPGEGVVSDGRRTVQSRTLGVRSDGERDNEVLKQF